MVTRRDILSGSVALIVHAATTPSSSAETTPSTSGSSLIPGPSHSGEEATTRTKWIAVAQSLKPELKTTVQTPRAVVRAIADPNLFLRWNMADETGSVLSERTFRKGDNFLLDFGGHRAGYFAFEVEGVGKSVDAPLWLRLTFGEVPGDVAEPLFPYHGDLSSSWLPQDEVKIDFLPQRVRLPRRYSYRYVKVEVLDTSPNFAVRFASTSALALTSAGPLSTPLHPSTLSWVKSVDEVGLATLRDCMQTTFEDGPRRDQRLWIGDLRLQAQASYLTFPNFNLVKRCLFLFAGLSRESDGFLTACVFEKPVPSTTGTYILDYAVLYGAILLDYVRASGDMATARELWPVALRQLQLLLVHVDDAGLFTIPPQEWAFVDWSTELDRAASMQGVVVYSCRRLLELAKVVGTEGEIAHFPVLIAKMVNCARNSFYDAALGVCVSGPKRQISWASQAWLTLGECISKEVAAAALRKAVLEDPTAVRPTTAYLYHHVVEAMIVCGLKTEALSLIRRYWGGMVDAGADTYWEAYDPKNSQYSPYGDVHINSFCHAWSCTPAYFFRANDGALIKS